ncbi:hypothetical protein KM043_011193 [Ampulex compressa]|nr:hypothetical protein KM043_011193 [Ampulex compressa]
MLYNSGRVQCKRHYSAYHVNVASQFRLVTPTNIISGNRKHTTVLQTSSEDPIDCFKKQLPCKRLSFNAMGYKLKSLQQEDGLPTETPVWTIGHAGHIQPPKDLRIAMPDDTKWDQCYGLSAQVQHKIEFIKKYVPEDGKIHIIGHSIGAWLALNMLKDDLIAKRVVKCYLIFPTIERMAESRNGQIFINIVQRIATLLIFLAWLFTFLPSFLQVLLEEKR